MIDLLEIDYQLHPLFHVSPKLFDFPSREEIFKAREWSTWHPNGVLGLWCSTFPNMCNAFGKHVYEVSLVDDARRMGVEFTDFYHLTRECENFLPLIEYFSKGADVIYLKDANPYVGEVIVINFDKIKSFEQTSGQRDQKYRLAFG